MSTWPRFADRLPDFEVAVTFLTPEEGGRTMPAHQGYRPDVVFADEPHTWMIWPKFLREDGSLYALHAPVDRRVKADMYVASAEDRPIVRPVVHVGRQLKMVEGSHAVAVGEVTAIKNLPNGLGEDVDAAIAFYEPARAYMRWFAQRRSDTGAVKFLELHAILARLQAAAAELPGVAPNESDERECAAGGSTTKLRETLDAELAVDAYGKIFDPLDDRDLSRVEASLKDDLEDIYADVTAGAALYDRYRYRDALWAWHLSYYTHWGRHLSGAQAAIWQYLSEGNRHAADH